MQCGSRGRAAGGGQRNRTSVRRASGTSASSPWTGGSSSYFATISGSASTFGSIGTVGASFSCSVPSTDGQFVLPSDVAFSLPASNPPAAPGYLSVQFTSFPPSPTIPGIDFGWLLLQMNQFSTAVAYQ